MVPVFGSWMWLYLPDALMWHPAFPMCFSQTRLLASHVVWGLEVPWNYTSHTGIALWCSVLSSNHELLEKSHQKMSEQA